jgi:hypothetical protein
MAIAMPLRPSVLTSSSPWLLSELAYDVRNRHGSNIGFDVFVPRHGHTQEAGVTNDITPTRLMLTPGKVDEIANKIHKRCETCRDWELSDGIADPVAIQFEAMATYFPDICSRDSALRGDAARAIENVFRVGLKLHELNPGRFRNRMVCVEVVCGALLKRYDDGNPDNPDEKNPWVAVFRRKDKLMWLFESFQGVVRAIEKDFRDAGLKFAIAMEFEPGAPYLFGLHSRGDYSALACADYATETRDLLELFVREIEFSGISGNLGVNFDLGHFRIAGIEPKAIEESGLSRHFVHAHICDHPPGMHTRDFPLGTWSRIGHPSMYAEYLSLLKRRAVHFAEHPDGLPFTGAVAIELEGCHHPGWLHSCIPALRSLLYQCNSN